MAEREPTASEERCLMIMAVTLMMVVMAVMG